MNFDEIDRLILEQLQLNARCSNKSLSLLADVSSPTMLNRIRALEAQGAISGYHAAVASKALNRRVEAIVSVRFSPKTAAVIEEFVAAVWEMDATVSVTVLTGAVDVQVHISAPDMETLGKTVLAHIAAAPNVTDESTTVILKHHRKHVLKSLD